ncbi:MptD family putative ECF transporter S component [Micromonospora sp. LOL_023]|uniref:MptD family putative ECF transporter S component n=1 Tax=Micromonospora sp. LOL_023 TaxID=3345418 RepID=UPI003A895198
MSDDTRSIATDTTTATPTRSPGFTLTFSARDLLNVAIFAVIYFVIVFAIAMLGVISPPVMLLTLPLSIIAAGVPYMLFLTRVKHAGPVTLFAIAVGGLYLIIGHPWISTLVTIGAALVAEVILWAGRYRSRWSAIVAYAVFSLWYIGPMLPLLMNRAEYLNSPGMQAMGQDYVDAFDQTVSVTVLWIYNASTFVCGLLGGLLGAYLLKKHFTRAGLA